MKELLERIVGLCLMRMVLDLALPEGDSRRYADLGMGLSVMLCLMQGLESLVRGSG